MSGKGQEAFNGLAHIQDGSGVHGGVVPFSKSVPQVTSEFIDQRRRKIGGVYIFVEEPLLKIPDVADGLAEAVDVEIEVNQMPQKRFPAGRQAWEPLLKGLGQAFQDFTKRVFVGRIGRMRPETVLVHERDLKLARRQARIKKIVALRDFRRVAAAAEAGFEATT